MQWKSIKDELPTEGQKVIYYFKYTGIDCGTFHRVQYPSDFIGCEMPVWGNQFRSKNGVLTDDVTHWMPLPEKP